MADYSTSSHFSQSSTNPYIPNSAQIPNILFDYWMQRLTPAEFKILMCIARKTYGWHKIKDRISLRQLTELTGLHKSGVIKATESLVEIGLVIKYKSKDSFDGSDAPNQYEIDVNFVKIEGVVDSVDTPRVDSVDTQNPLSTKPNRYTHIGDTCDFVDPPPESDPQKKDSKKTQRAKHVTTTSAEHKKLVEEYGEDMVRKAYIRLSEWKEDTPKSKWKKCDYRSILRWVMEAVRESASKKKPGFTNIEKNKKLAQSVYDKFRNRQDIILGNTYIEFLNGMTSEHIGFEDNAFKERLINQLRKRRIDVGEWLKD